MNIGSIKINISHCIEGIYLRWWFNGWHHFLFQNGYEIQMQTESMDTQVTKLFSRISKIERPTKLKAKYSYRVILEGITAENIAGFNGLLLAEKVEQYESGSWREVDITRNEHTIRNENAPGYIIDFEITRKELPDTPSVFQKILKLYIGDILCDIDDDEVIAINKQVNDIAEMQDRQSDFTPSFKIRKTRPMKELFELSGETGIDTSFPYQKQTCKLIQDNIETITNGIPVLDNVDEYYYYVSIMCGNKSFFKKIEKLKITDLTLASTNHTWDITDQKMSHDASPETDYLYPLCDPSDDAGCGRRFANSIEMYGGWIWPFIKVETIWNEIFSNAGYYCSGKILTDNRFLNLFIPVTGLKINDALKNNYLYSGWRMGYMNIAIPSIFGTGGTGTLSLIKGDALFASGHYTVPFTANYKIVVTLTFAAGHPAIYLYVNNVNTSTFNETFWDGTHSTHEWTRAATAGEDLAIWGDANTYYNIQIAYVEITDAKIAFGSPIVPHLCLPEMTQTDFIKLICNMFALIPEVTPRDKKIYFWNFLELYDNIAIARDWSNYLSERDDNIEFKFGNYAQSNYLRYKKSDDVIIDNGKGTMIIDDETLESEKDIVEASVSTCDEVIVMTDVNISRIAFNTFNADTSLYDQKESIDPRIVYIKRATGKELILWDDEAMIGNHVHISDPKTATSIDVSFSTFIVNYASLSRMLTKTNMRKTKFNLPVYEMANLKHYIPIYLNQYKAYFYVNKVNNYVPGKLCIVELIKL